MAIGYGVYRPSSGPDAEHFRPGAHLDDAVIVGVGDRQPVLPGRGDPGGFPDRQADRTLAGEPGFAHVRDRAFLKIEIAS